MNAPRQDGNLTPEELRAALAYDPVTGLFTWKVQRGRQKAGQPAGGPHPRGYRTIRIKRLGYLAHRLAWFYVHGAWPVDQIDHRDGNRANNALDNLRPATSFQNNQNRTPDAMRAGLKGVKLHKQSGLWQAKIRANNKEVSLGYYKTPEEAHAAYIKAAPTHHGQFARVAP